SSRGTEQGSGSDHLCFMGTKVPPTYPGSCILQVCGVHCGAQCHRARFCLLQVLLHLHQAQLQVHPSALLPFAFFFYLLQSLLQALVCEGRGNLVLAGNSRGEQGPGHVLYIFLTFCPKRDCDRATLCPPAPRGLAGGRRCSAAASGF
uniref:Uncharacterized protein n=1 Tax=Otus sunia TaxID=257818 RepID=A0A8C8EDZ0_9STRI